MTQLMSEDRQRLLIVANGCDQIVQHDDRSVGHGERIRTKLRRTAENQIRFRGTAFRQLQRMQAGTQRFLTLLRNLARLENIAVQ